MINLFLCFAVAQLSRDWLMEYIRELVGVHVFLLKWPYPLNGIIPRKKVKAYFKINNDWPKCMACLLRSQAGRGVETQYLREHK